MTTVGYWVLAVAVALVPVPVVAVTLHSQSLFHTTPKNMMLDSLTPWDEFYERGLFILSSHEWLVLQASTRHEVKNQHSMTSDDWGSSTRLGQNHFFTVSLFGVKSSRPTRQLDPRDNSTSCDNYDADNSTQFIICISPVKN